MAKLRTIVTALVVCALAVLPAASASAAARMASSMSPVSVEKGGGEQSSMRGDCENHMGMKMGAADNGDASAPSSVDHGACPGGGCSKCPCFGLAVTGVLAMGPATPSFAFAAVPTGWATPSLLAPSILPPSPPPRV